MIKTVETFENRKVIKARKPILKIEFVPISIKKTYFLGILLRTKKTIIHE